MRVLAAWLTPKTEQGVDLGSRTVHGITGGRERGLSGGVPGARPVRPQCVDDDVLAVFHLRYSAEEYVHGAAGDQLAAARVDAHDGAVPGGAVVQGR
ncbi:hypothetical protein [Streptomyces ipomoeae]|uniref:hypothetical protein n=1 Tax=Streptomyces ipomoeae TaxID=103232 RepID=UPI00066276D1|nr:hypothetical protein [Streptomyces ipomoeae]MDX2692292.1 hypothetical protein [Streptomyces ipomoeae]MDX2837878.1 hypothetical protein [Streptomyces ipomoeae]